MGIAKLKNRFPPQERSSHLCHAGRTLRWVLMGFGLFFLLSLGVAIGYISRMNVDTSYGRNRRNPKRRFQNDQLSNLDDEDNHLSAKYPLAKAGMEFSGYNNYRIQEFSDSSTFSISIWFSLASNVEGNDLYIIGNRMMECTDESCGGFLLYYSMAKKKLRLVWKTSMSDNQMENINSNALDKANWNNVVLVMKHDNKAAKTGFKQTTMRIFVNGRLIFHQSAQFGFHGQGPLFVGSTPDLKYHFYGRLYSLMLFSTSITESQARQLYLNDDKQVRSLANKSTAIHLTKSAPAPPVRSRTDAPSPINVSSGSFRTISGNRKKPMQAKKLSDELSADYSSSSSDTDTDTDAMTTFTKVESRSSDGSDNEVKPSVKSSKRSAQDKSTRSIKASDAFPTSHSDSSTSETDLLSAYHNRGEFTLNEAANRLRSESYPQPPAPSEGLCAGVLPESIPPPTPALQSFIDSLLTIDSSTLSAGKFSYSVPADLHNDYHHLSEYRAKHLRDAFCFAWGNYRERAWGADEIHPVDGTPGRDWGGIGMTLLDSIDTLKILGLEKDFEAAKEWVAKKANFDQNRQAPVFEFNIRIVGGLLAAYDLSKDKVFLDKARDMADRLLPAFDTPSGYPKSYVNLHTGASSVANWTRGSVILAELGTMSLEFLYLSHHTGDPKYKKAIDRIYKTLERTSTDDGLLPTFLSPLTGEGTHGDYSMGAMADSYYEYLLKMWIQGGKKDETLRHLYNDAVDGMTRQLFRRSKTGLLYCGVKRGNGHFKPEMGHLTCFVGGMLALGVLHNVNPDTRDRDLENAKALGYTCYMMYMQTATGIMGEAMLFNKGDMPDVNSQATYYILRPEAMETLYYLNQITGDPIYREWGWKMWSNIERECRTKYGYGHLRDVRRKGSVENRAESFFFAETAKYVYMLFKDEKVVDLEKQVITTEAHPLRVFTSD